MYKHSLAAETIFKRHEMIMIWNTKKRVTTQNLTLKKETCNLNVQKNISKSH